jgi:hypothetical protein
MGERDAMSWLRWVFVDGDWTLRSAGGLLVLCVVALVGLLVSLPWIIAADERERGALAAEGCEVVSTRQTTWFMPVRSGNVTMFLPQSRTVETWRCPDGREFER